MQLSRRLPSSNDRSLEFKDFTAESLPFKGFVVFAPFLYGRRLVMLVLLMGLSDNSFDGVFTITVLVGGGDRKALRALFYVLD